ncbi:hypothetical protein ElyMa_006956900 [Elysia marginata]|uniref:Uncharacterized protein n=1 Tax=Elysia marginata TaxID=1093978 RepID=A0AAV4JIZ6_9GAST|nr:hypothetical protein ElyMa_006956900 [Elysia marginata]
MSCPGQSITERQGCQKEQSPANIEMTCSTDKKETVSSTGPPSSTSSPKDATASNGGLASTTNASNLSDSDVDKGSSTPEKMFLSRLLDSPVTETTTGLVYKNRSVATCNGVLSEHILPWTIQAPLKSLFTNPTDVASLDEIVSTSVAVYRFPGPSQPFAKGSECILSSRRDCKKEWLISRPDLESMCRDGGIAYHQTKSPLARNIFDNIYCFICYFGLDDYSKPVLKHIPSERTFMLSLLASLTSTGAITLEVVTGEKLAIWKSAQCSVSAEEKGGGKCHRDQCGESYELRPDGVCRMLFRVEFAFTGEECPYQNSKETTETFLSILTCYMKTYENAEIDNESIQFDEVVDKRMNTSLVRMRALAYYPYFKYGERRQARILRELMMLIHRANFCCDPHPRPSVCVDSSCRLGGLKVPSLNSFLARVDSINSEVASNRSVIICVESLKLSLWQDGLNLRCLQEPVFVSLLPFYHRAANVSCLGDHVQRHADDGQQRRMCNRSNRGFGGLWLVLSLFALVCAEVNPRGVIGRSDWP